MATRQIDKSCAGLGVARRLARRGVLQGAAYAYHSVLSSPVM
jgi:hypothetical protein